MYNLVFAWLAIFTELCHVWPVPTSKLLGNVLAIFFNGRMPSCCQTNSPEAMKDLQSACWHYESQTMQQLLWLQGSSLSFIHPHFWRSETSDHDTKDLRALLSHAIWTHSGIDNPVQSFTPSVQQAEKMHEDLCVIITGLRFSEMKMNQGTTMLS